MGVGYWWGNLKETTHQQDLVTDEKCDIELDHSWEGKVVNLSHQVWDRDNWPTVVNEAVKFRVHCNAGIPRLPEELLAAKGGLSALDFVAEKCNRQSVINVWAETGLGINQAQPILMMEFSLQPIYSPCFVTVEILQAVLVSCVSVINISPVPGDTATRFAHVTCAARRKL